MRFRPKASQQKRMVEVEVEVDGGVAMYVSLPKRVSMWPVGVLWEWMAPLKQSGQDIVFYSGLWFAS